MVQKVTTGLYLELNQDFEPVTFCTLNRNHTNRPTSLVFLLYFQMLKLFEFFYSNRISLLES